MAINVGDIFSDNCREKCHSNCSTPRRLIKLDFSTDDSSLTTIKFGNSKKRNVLSPYLNEDKVHLLSRMMEKRVTNKNSPNFVSSFTLATNVYKANSDELKSRKRNNKKIKKSVLTLPNKFTLTPQECTVSDMNESEYFIRQDDNCKLKTKKRFSVKTYKKPLVDKKMFEVYDRDARYCSQLNIDLDCSSTEMLNNFNGDGMGVSNNKSTSQKCDKDYDAHNVWAMLRNINRFQYIVSPTMSECSIKSHNKKRTLTKKCPKRKNSRYVESCRTEEFSFVKCVDAGKSTNLSLNSSFDRITVIEKQDSTGELCRDYKKKRVRALNRTKVKNHNRTPDQSRNIKEKKKSLNCNNLNDVKDKEYSYSTVSPRQNNSDICEREIGSYDFEFTDDLNNFQCLGSTDQPINNCEVNDKVKEICNITKIIQTKSNSNKEGFNSSKKLSKDKDTSTIDSGHQGNRKVISDNDQGNLVLHKQHHIPSRNNRYQQQFTIMSSSMTTPKLTRTEIKRQLANIKFPLIILGKDQLSSTIEVINYDPPQLDGLDRHIWPFMLDWCETNGNENNKRPCKRNDIHSGIYKNGQNCKWPIERKPSKFSRESEEKFIHNLKNGKFAKTFASKKRDQTPIKHPVEITTSQSTKKSKQTSQLNGKMLKLFHKKSVLNSSNSKEDINKRRYAKNSDDLKNTKQSKTNGDISAETDTKVNLVSERRKIFETKNDKQATTKHRWGRVKWANDFIENVIKKIKNGIYYTQGNKGSHIKSFDVTEDYKQSIAVVSLNDKQECTECYSEHSLSLSNGGTSKIISNEKHDLLKSIGFDETFCELEVEVLNMEQIAIKHCLTNIIVQFDVKVPTEPTHVLVNVKKSLACVPISVDDGTLKTFKCNTAILNAVLPAELCSILPKVMQTIMNAEKTAKLNITAPERSFHLSTISEISRRDDSPDPYMSIPLPLIGMSQKIRLLLIGGEFRNIATKRYVLKCMNAKTALRKFNRETKIIPKFNTHLICSCIINPKSLDLTSTETTCSDILRSNEFIHLKKLQKTSQCKALVPYTAPVNSFVVNNQMEQFCKHIRTLSWYIYLFQINCVKNDITDNLIRGNDWSLVNKFKPNSNNKIVEIDTLYKGDNHQGVIVGKVISITNTHEYPQKITSYANNKGEGLRSQQSIIYKTKKRQLVKLHKKCKSTSNIHREKCYIPLNKIKNIEDFCQVLGSGKLLSSVFNGYTEQNILLTLEQMKKWVSEISSTQALLIVLLINKKDTSNLVRFRHILLQGIAMNRITRAIELDMEIEVIEREQFNELPQYEGISYLPASVENQDSLLEELYWIAKTTASDYQKPFDESSEKLLKALLQKRKKLNPSYLRVMARYVGLGLLKPLKITKVTHQ